MLAIGLSSSSRTMSVPAVAVYSIDLPPRLSRCWVTDACGVGSRIHCSFFSPFMSMRHSCDSCAGEDAALPPAGAGGAAPPSPPVESCAYAAPTNPKVTITPIHRRGDICTLPRLLRVELARVRCGTSARLYHGGAGRRCKIGGDGHRRSSAVDPLLRH